MELEEYGRKSTAGNREVKIMYFKDSHSKVFRNVIKELEAHKNWSIEKSEKAAAAVTRATFRTTTDLVPAESPQ